MKRSTLIFISLGLLLWSVPGHGQEKEEEPSPYYVKAQFAGDIGLVSGGLGRQSFDRKLETDVSLGYLPRKWGGAPIFTAAIKSTLLPFRPVKVRDVDWHAFSTGMQVSYTFGDKYFALERFQSRYPNSYYRFSTALRLYVFAGGQVNFARIAKLSRLGIYYEVGTMGEYLISYIQNPRYLSPGKIFNLAFGAKVRL